MEETIALMVVAVIIVFLAIYRVPASFLKVVDDWRRRQPELPFRGHPPFGRARAEGEAQKDIGSIARKLKLLAGLSPKIAACLNSQSNRGRLKKAPETNPATGKKDMVWFALNDDRLLFAFAGIWTEFRGNRGTKSKPIPGSHLVYGFLTTAANAVVETDTP